MTTRLGSRIKSLRAERMVGVRELGRMVGVSAMHISNIENGKSSASTEIIQKIAMRLEANADELLALADQIAPDVVDVINSNCEAVPSLLRAARDLKPEQWAELLRRVEEMKSS